MTSNYKPHLKPATPIDDELAKPHPEELTEIQRKIEDTEAEAEPGQPDDESAY